MHVVHKKIISKQTVTVCFLSFLWSILLVINLASANCIKSTFDYDDLHRLTSIQHKQGTTILSQFNYALSADGKRNTLQEYLKYPTGQTIASVNRTVFYGYDAAGRLYAEQRQSTSTLAAGGTIQNTARTMWTYDKVGNRLTQAVSNYDGIGIDSPSVLKSTFNTSYSYNNNDWLTSTTSVKDDDGVESTYKTNFEYNANGSQSAVTTNVGTPDEKRIPYFYDFEEKLLRIGDTSDTINHAYAYDADGNRIAESNTTGSGTDVRNYLVDPNNSNAQVLEEYNNANTLLAHYDWNDVELLREANLDETTNTFTIREPLADGHNSTRQLLDSTGAISDVYAFDAWGNQQVNAGGSFNPYRYNAQRLDASGLYNLRARQYASGIGRFLTQDPLMGSVNDPITQHRYLYVYDDPINFEDPSGKYGDLGSLQTGISGAGVVDTNVGLVSSDVAYSFSSAELALTQEATATAGTTAGGVSGLTTTLILVGIAATFPIAAILDDTAITTDAKQDEPGQNQMRVQLQDSKLGRTIHTSSVSLSAPATPGVTTLEVRTAMYILYEAIRNSFSPGFGYLGDDLSWFPKNQTKRYIKEMASSSIELKRFPPGGIAGQNPYVLGKGKHQWAYTKNTTIRLEIENLRGWNLRS